MRTIVEALPFLLPLYWWLWPSPAHAAWGEPQMAGLLVFCTLPLIGAATLARLVRL